MRHYFLRGLWRDHGGAITIVGGLLFLLIVLPILLLNTTQSTLPVKPTPAVSPMAPTVPATATPAPTTAPLPTATPTVPARTTSLNPAHGIHAPIGNQWTDTLRQALTDFRDGNDESGPPGAVVVLSNDLNANNNSAHVRMEEDLHQYERQGSQIYVRIYPQRFPGGYSEAFHTKDNPNTISGSPQDAAEDVFRLVAAQQARNGWHFSQIIIGNEPDLEWPNQLYAQNLLPWQSNGDPRKYVEMNDFYQQVYRAWQARRQQADAVLFQDVTLYFPPLAQDATPNSDFYAGFYYYDNGQPIGNRYDALRPAIELYAHFAWHNYFEPGRACQEIAANAFPAWLKADLESGWPAVIGEAGWSPASLVLPSQYDDRADIVHFWQALGVKWEPQLYIDDRPQWRTQDETINGAAFENDLSQFVDGCYQGDLKLKQPVGIAAWLAGSEGNFIAAVGVEPGTLPVVRRWLHAYAELPL